MVKDFTCLFLTLYPYCDKSPVPQCGQSSRMASATSSGSAPVGLDDGVGDLSVQRVTWSEDVGDLVERPGRGQRGPAASPPGSAWSRAASTSGSAGSQTTNPKSRSSRRFASRSTTPPPVARIASRPGRGQLGEHALFPVAEGRLALLGEDRGGSTGRRSLSSFDIGIDERPASRSARIRPTVDFPVPREPTSASPCGVKRSVRSFAERSELALQGVAHRRRPGRPARCRA